jgi:tetratricopeptide (TPR) repeat protein
MSESVTLKESGILKFKAGDLDGAIADWKAAMEANTGNGDTAFLVFCSSNIAQTCTKKSDWQNVCKFATDAIDCDAKHVKFLLRRGVALCNLGRIDEAKSDLQRALQLEDSPDVQRAVALRHGMCSAGCRKQRRPAWYAV